MDTEIKHKGVVGMWKCNWKDAMSRDIFLVQIGRGGYDL